jgi:hypothetical protein
MTPLRPSTQSYLTEVDTVDCGGGFYAADECFTDSFDDRDEEDTWDAES